MNLVFLGLRGVVWSGAVKGDRFEDTTPCNPDALRLLDDICREAQAGVVVCAPERTQHYDTEWWTEYFHAQGATNITVVGLTPIIHKELRGYEVVRYREQQGNQGAGSYAILDATGNYLVWQPVIKVNANHGIQCRDAYEALRQLNPQSDLLGRWDRSFGYGDLLRMVERPRSRQQRLAA